MSHVLAARAWLRSKLVDPEPPLVAVEVRPRAVGVVRLARESRAVRLAGAAAMELPAGAVVPSLAQPNVVDGGALRAALRAALERTGVLGGAAAALVLPDPAVRVIMMPRAEVAAGASRETEDLLRFKLRKVLPFDVRDARLSWRGSEAPAAPVVVAVALQSVVREYEQACEEVGLRCGLVLPAVLALAGAVPGTGDRLLLNWDDEYVSIVLLRDGWPTLVRTLSGPSAVDPAGVAREVGSTAVYYTERLGGGRLEHVSVRVGLDGVDGALDALGRAVAVDVGLADAWSRLSGDPGPLSQSLAGAAAALSGAAA